MIIRTKLVIPSLPDSYDPFRDFYDTADSCSFDATKADKLNQEELAHQVEDMGTDIQPVSLGYLTLHSIEHGGKPQEVSETLVVRIEVEDTGCGIKPSDIYVGKPFLDFNQTGQGRQPLSFLTLICFMILFRRESYRSWPSVGTTARRN